MNVSQQKKGQDPNKNVKTNLSLFGERVKSDEYIQEVAATWFMWPERETVRWNPHNSAMLNLRGARLRLTHLLCESATHTYTHAQITFPPISCTHTSTHAHANRFAKPVLYKEAQSQTGTQIHTSTRKRNVTVATSLNLVAQQPVGSECECFYFLSTGCRLGDGQEMDFSLGSAQMQSLTVSPGQRGLLALRSVAFHGIIEFRKRCGYMLGVLQHTGNNGKVWIERGKKIVIIKQRLLN